MKGWMYILRCNDGTYYTGSTNNLLRRKDEHDKGVGSNYTKSRRPLEIIYIEEYSHVSRAFQREKQVQGWRRTKKEALMAGETHLLPEMSLAYRDKSTIDILLDEMREFPSLPNAS